MIMLYINNAAGHAFFQCHALHLIEAFLRKAFQLQLMGDTHITREVIPKFTSLVACHEVRAQEESSSLRNAFGMNPVMGVQGCSGATCANAATPMVSTVAAVLMGAAKSAYIKLLPSIK
jgi:hypothetical protein